MPLRQAHRRSWGRLFGDDHFGIFGRHDKSIRTVDVELGREGAQAVLERQPRRTVTVAGNTAFAETLQALGTIARLEQDGIFFVIDNRVMAVEEWLIDGNVYYPNAPLPEFKELTAVPQGHIWDYVKLAEGFGSKGYRLQTNAELTVVLRKLKEMPTGPVTGKPTFSLVAVRIPVKDAPDATLWRLNCKG